MIPGAPDGGGLESADDAVAGGLFLTTGVWLVLISVS